MNTFEIRIKPKDYEPAQLVLIDLWEKHLKNVRNGINLGFVTFTNKRPKNPKTDNRRIAGLKAESVSYLRDDRELVRMTDENFIYLMARMGIDLEMTEGGE